MRRRPLAASVLAALACVVLALGFQAEPDVAPQSAASLTTKSAVDRHHLALSPSEELADRIQGVGDDLPLLGLLLVTIVLLRSGARSNTRDDRPLTTHRVIGTERLRPRAPPFAPVLA